MDKCNTTNMDSLHLLYLGLTGSENPEVIFLENRELKKKIQKYWKTEKYIHVIYSTCIQYLVRAHFA